LSYKKYTKNINTTIPNEYTKLYNSFLYKIRRQIYIKPYSTIKFEISDLQYDNEDSFYPYKFYIYLNKNNNNEMKFEIFLSTIICKYTIRSIDINVNIENDLAIDKKQCSIDNNKNIINSFAFLQDNEKKIYQQIKGYNKIENVINEILTQYKIIYNEFIGMECR
jgi:hypothetical protein